MTHENAGEAVERGAGLPQRAKVFLVGTGVAAAAATVPACLHGGPTHDWWRFAVIVVAASVTQLFAFHTVRNQVFHTTPLFFVAGALLLPPQLLVLVPLVSHVPDWLRKRYAWYIQTFNILNFTLAAMCAWAIARLVRADVHGQGGTWAAAAAAAATAYFLLNNGGFTAILHLARGHRPSEILTGATLAADASLASLGVLFASLWRANEFLVPFTVLPVFLLHAALHLPQLQEEARADAKTGLANARHFMEALSEELTRARRFGRPLSVIVADLDLLRNVNNTYGHLAGDAVLAGVAEIFRAHLRRYDVAARFGGEEFAIVLPETSAREALEIAERIRAAVATTPIWAESARQHVNVTISIGVATFPGHGTDPDDLLHNADLASYHAKVQGRNRVVRASRRPRLVAVAPEPRPFASGEAGGQPPAAPPTDDVPTRRILALETWQPRTVALAVGAVGLAATLAAGVLGRSDDVWGLVALAALAVVGQALALDLDHGTISAAPIAMLAGAAAFGLRGALLAAVTVAVDAGVRRLPWPHALLALGARSLSQLVAVGVFALARLTGHGDLVGLALGLVAGGLALAVASAPLALVVAVEGRESWWRAWRDRYLWLVPNYAIYGFMAAVTAVAYQRAGLYGLGAFGVSLLAIRRTLQAVVAQGQRSVEGLRHAAQTIQRQNDSLQVVNRLLRERSSSAMESLSGIVDRRDAYMSGHSRCVRDLALAMARELGVSAAELSVLARAALFHDIGKLTVPDAILLKKDALTDEERATLQRHADEGARIIERLGFLDDAVPLIRHHHERVDGTGYPDGLAGAAIPLGARIIHVADAYDSMRTTRTYRQGRSVAEALQELRQLAGAQFDPLCVDALEKVLRRGVGGDRLGRLHGIVL